MKQTSQTWQFLTEDVEAIIEGLEQAEFDAIYPASPTLFDRFLAYLDKIGVRQTLEEFPDPRRRRSIPVRLLAQVLLVRPLFAVSSLSKLGAVLSMDRAVLQLLGFNAHSIEHGFRENANRCPFDEEALADFGAQISAQDCLEHSIAVVKLLIGANPEYFEGATIVVDSKEVYASAGKSRPQQGDRLPPVKLKACTLSLLVKGRAVPMVWLFAPDTQAEVTLGKALLEAALPTLVRAGVVQLVVDAGYVDGEWLGGLARQWGLRIIIKLKEKMHLWADALGCTRVRDVLRPQARFSWVEAPPPKLKGKPLPRRQVGLVRELHSWDALGQPVDALVIRDAYPDGRMQEAVIGVIGNAEPDPLVLLEEWRSRWGIEEFFMEADRYQQLGRLFPCREGFARTWVHFAFLAYTLLLLFDLHTCDKQEPLAATRELLVIRGPHYGLISLGQFAVILLDHHDTWQSKRQQVMTKLGHHEHLP